MTTEFLFFADLALLLRLRLLLGDLPVWWPRWLAKAVIEVLALTMCVPHLFLLGAALTILALNLAAAWWDERASDPSGGRLLFGLLELLVLSVWFSPAGGVEFRPGLVEFVHRLLRWTALGESVHAWLGPVGLRTTFGLLLAANEANLLVRWLLWRLKISPGMPSLLGPELDRSELNRGRIVGLLERSLIYFFVLTGQYGAIGFTLAAKGFTRFKELDNRGFAEYVLIGTLLSSSVAMGIGAWVKLGL